MANWPTNPDWIPLSSINGGKEVTASDGFRASDQNKIVSNLLYLYQHFSAQHVYVGNVTTVTGDEKTEAAVQITSRAIDTDANGETELYLDFTFRIPRGNTGDGALVVTIMAHSANASGPTTGDFSSVYNEEWYNRKPKVGDVYVSYTDYSYATPKPVWLSLNKVTSVRDNLANGDTFGINCFYVAKLTGEKGSKGDKGDTGLSALIRNKIYESPFEPEIGVTYDIGSTENFSRTPVVNEAIVFLWNSTTSDRVYAVTGVIKTSSTSIITAQVNSFIDIKGQNATNNSLITQVEEVLPTVTESSPDFVELSNSATDGLYRKVKQSNKYTQLINNKSNYGSVPIFWENSDEYGQNTQVTYRGFYAYTNSDQIANIAYTSDGIKKTNSDEETVTLTFPDENGVFATREWVNNVLGDIGTALETILGV